MDSLNASLEAEQRSKTEALRIKKKLESDINELEIALDHSNKANAEGQKAIKRYQGTLRDTIQSYEDEARLRQQIMESVGISERKANALSGEVTTPQQCRLHYYYNIFQYLKRLHIFLMTVIS